MEKKFLEDYSQKEEESYQKFIKNSKNAEQFGQYPSDDRFSSLHAPMMFFDPFSYNNYGEKIWTQVPFTPTLVISLRNVREKDCLQYHGFEPSDIPHLIELSKDTGKIQFGLQGDPLEYQDLNYLDDIFTELKPPTFRSLPFEFFTNANNLKHWGVSFDQLGFIRYFTELDKMNAHAGEVYSRSIQNQHKGIYFSLKILEWTDEIEELENLMVSEPEHAAMLFEKYAILMNSKFSSFCPNVNWGLKELQRYDIAPKKIPNVFHPEIGTHILKKAVLNPSNYHECRNVIDHYDHNQLYSVYESLYRSMQNQHYDDLTNHTETIKEIMDNAWQDGVKLVGRQKTIRIGLDVVVGMIGYGVTEMIAMGSIGLLSSLGFHVLDSNTPWSNKISEKLLRKLQPDYLINIYDFHKDIKKH